MLKYIDNLKLLLKHKEIHKFVNYYIFTLVNAGISIYSISYMTKHIPPSDYGMIGIFTSILFFIPSLISFSVNGLQAIEIVNLDKDKYLYFRNNYISFVLLSFIFYLLISILISFYYTRFSYVIILAIILGFIQTLSSIHNTELFQNSQPTRFGLVTTGTVLLGFMFTIAFISIFNLDWKSRIIALLTSELFFLYLRFFILSSIGSSFKFIFDKIHFKYFIKYGAPLIISVVAGWILNQSDRYFLLNYFSLKEVGLYAAAAGISSFIIMINSNMIKVTYPLVYNKLFNRVGKKFILRLTLLYSILILTISISFCIGLYFFGYLFLGDKYLPSMPIIYIMCIAQAFFGIYTTTGLVIDYFKMTKLKTILVVSSAFLVVILTFILIPIIGIYAPAIATLFAFTFLSIISFFITLNLFKKYKIH